MSKKYIAQVEKYDFVFPNNDLFEYDVEIIHDLKNNSVNGTISNFIASFTNNNKSLSISFDYTWNLNGAEPSFLKNGQLSLLSVHMLTPNQQYFKPWILIDNESTSNVSATSVSSSVNFTYSYNNTTLPQGNYYFEFRFIGHRCIYPLGVKYPISYPVPTPTPTASPTSTPISANCTLNGTAISV